MYADELIIQVDPLLFFLLVGRTGVHNVYKYHKYWCILHVNS